MSNRNSPIINLKIISALIIAFFLTIFLSKFFSGSSPRLNRFLISSLPDKTRQFITQLFPKKNPSPSPIINSKLKPTTTQISNIQYPISSSPFPTISNYLKPIKTIFPSPTSTNNYQPPTNPVSNIKYQISKPPSPTLTNNQQPTTDNRQPTTKLPSFNCPTISSQQYSSLPADHSGGKLNHPENNPDINVRLRGFVEVNESTNFISRHGDTYGLDEKMPPQLSTLFGGPRPQIIKTYRIYEWDYQKGKSAAPQTATANFKVHMIGLKATPGQKLVGLQAGRDIGGGNVFMVLYASKNDIVFCHGISDYLTADDMPCYLFMFLDICVDPNLLALYQKSDTEGRNQLPVIAPGQVFGYATNTDIKVVVRDSFSFMDTRYNEDWWDYGK